MPGPSAIPYVGPACTSRSRVPISVATTLRSIGTAVCCGHPAARSTVRTALTGAGPSKEASRRVSTSGAVLGWAGALSRNA